MAKSTLPIKSIEDQYFDSLKRKFNLERKSLSKEFCRWLKRQIDDEIPFLNWIRDSTTDKLENDSIAALHFVEWVFSNESHIHAMDVKGINFEGLSTKASACIDLKRINLQFSFTLKGCKFPGIILDFSKSVFGDLDFQATELKQLIACDIRSNGSVAFTSSIDSSFIAHEGVNLMNAQIGGNLDFQGASLCGGAIFDNDFGSQIPKSLFGKGLICRGSVLIGQGFVADYQVNFNDTKIDGSVVARGGNFSKGLDTGSYSPNTALSLKRTTVKGSLLLGNKRSSDRLQCSPFSFKANGTVNLVNAEVQGILDLRCSEIRSSGDPRNQNADVITHHTRTQRIDHGASLYARGARILKTLIISNSKFQGPIWLDGTEVGSLLRIENSTISGVKLSADTRIRGTEAQIRSANSVNAKGLIVGRNVEILGSSLLGAVVLDNSNISSGVLVRECEIRNNFLGQKIDQLICGIAFSAQRTSIKGDLDLEAISCKGCINISSSTILGDFSINGGDSDDGKFNITNLISEDEKIEISRLFKDYSKSQSALGTESQIYLSNQAIIAKRTSIMGEVNIVGPPKNSKILGAILFDESRIGGSLRLGGCFRSNSSTKEVTNEESATVSFRNTIIGKSVIFEEILVAKIIECGISTADNVYPPLPPFSFEKPLLAQYAAVDFSHSSIADTFLAGQRMSVKSHSIRIIGSANLRGAQIGNHVDFRGVKICPSWLRYRKGGNGDSSRSDRAFENQWILDASYLNVKHRFSWRLKATPSGFIRLSDATIQSLDDSVTSWPTLSDHCSLERFTFKRFQARNLDQSIDIEKNTSPDCGFRLRLLRNYINDEDEFLRRYYFNTDVRKMHPENEDWQRRFSLLVHIFRHHPIGAPLTLSVCLSLVFTSLSGWIFIPVLVVISVFSLLIAFLATGFEVPDWLEIQKKSFRDHFEPGAHKVLSDAYREMGSSIDADSALIANSRERYLWGSMPFGKRLLEWGLMWFGFGFKPWMAIFYLAVGIFFSSLLFANTAVWPSKTSLFLKDGDTRFKEAVDGNNAINLSASHTGLVDGENSEKIYQKMSQQVVPLGYPDFHSVIFAIDVFIPLVDFHQENYWIPITAKGKTLLWAFKAMGWILSTFTVAALTRQIRT